MSCEGEEDVRERHNHLWGEEAVVQANASQGESR